MKISYLVGVHNETTELKFLLDKLISYIVANGLVDEIVILDDYSTNETTVEILNWTKQFSFIKILQNHLNGDFGNHKTIGSRACSGDYIVNFDADEYPTSALLENINALISLNPTVELFWVPRINIVRGLTPDDAKNWGWKIYSLDAFPDLPLVNPPDNQGRIYRNAPARIKWARRVHEVIIGANSTSILPFDPDFAIIHDKTIDKQRSQNALYSTMIG